MASKHIKSPHKYITKAAEKQTRAATQMHDLRHAERRTIKMMDRVRMMDGCPHLFPDDRAPQGHGTAASRKAWPVPLPPPMPRIRPVPVPPPMPRIRPETPLSLQLQDYLQLAQISEKQYKLGVKHRAARRAEEAKFINQHLGTELTMREADLIIKLAALLC